MCFNYLVASPGARLNRELRTRPRCVSVSMLLLACIISLINPAVLQDARGASDPVFTSLCIEDESTGFHWKEGKWSRAKFIPEKFLVEKLDLESIEDTSDSSVPAACVGMPGNSEDGFRNGCYDIRSFGEERNPYSGQVCRELWSEDSEGENLLQVICDGRITSMIFEPTGNFHYSKVHWLVSDDPDSDERDSLVLSIGSCSRL